MSTATINPATDEASVAPAPSIRDLIRDALAEAKTPDLDAIAADVLGRLDDDQYERAAYYGVRSLVGEEAGVHRRRQTRPHAETGTTRRSPRSARREKAAKASKRRPELFQSTILIGYQENGLPETKFLGDCDAADLKAAAAIQRDLGDKHQARAYSTAAQYETLARKLKGKALVSTLPVDTVQAVFQEV